MTERTVQHLLTEAPAGLKRQRRSGDLCTQSVPQRKHLKGQRCHQAKQQQLLPRGGLRYQPEGLFARNFSLLTLDA